MPTDVKVPMLGESITEATLGAWLKHPGDAVTADEPIATLETDKVSVDVPSPVAGIFGEALVKEGDTVAVGAIIALEMAGVLMGGFRLNESPHAMASAANSSNTLELGKLLYKDYLYPLEIAAVILLVAIIAAIALTLRTRKDSKHMNPSDQVRVKARDRVRVVQMGVTRPAQPVLDIAAPGAPAAPVSGGGKA